MTTRRALPAVLVLAATLLVPAGHARPAASEHQLAPGGRWPASTAERCSAASLPPGRRDARVPRAVDSMRLRIIAAARRCDYAALVRLGDEVRRGLAFSYGGSRSAPQFWRMLERNGPEPRPMEALVRVLAMPFAAIRADGTRAGGGRPAFYVWPSAHRANPSNADWQALRTLYPPAQIERLRRGGTGYLGYRVGITPAGDWQYFIAGD